MGKYTKEQIKQQRIIDIFEDNKYEQERCLKCIYFDAFNLANKFPCTNCDPCGEARYFTKPQKFNFKGKNKMNMNLFDIGTFEGFDAQIGVVEDVETYNVEFFYRDQPIELPEGYTSKLENETVDTLVLQVPKTVYGSNGEPFDPLDYFQGLHITVNNGGSYKLRDVAERLFVWSRWGNKKGLVPDPVLESAEDYGQLVEKLAALQKFLYERR